MSKIISKMKKTKRTNFNDLPVGAFFLTGKCDELDAWDDVLDQPLDFVYVNMKLNAETFLTFEYIFERDELNVDVSGIKECTYRFIDNCYEIDVDLVVNGFKK